ARHSVPPVRCDLPCRARGSALQPSAPLRWPTMDGLCSWESSIHFERLSAFGSRLSGRSRLPAALGFRLSAFGSRLSALGSRLSALCSRPSALGSWLPAFGSRPHGETRGSDSGSQERDDRPAPPS